MRLIGNSRDRVLWLDSLVIATGLKYDEQQQSNCGQRCSDPDNTILGMATGLRTDRLNVQLKLAILQ